MVVVAAKEMTVAGVRKGVGVKKNLNDFFMLITLFDILTLGLI